MSERRYELLAGVVARPVSDGGIAVHLVEDRFFQLNGTALAIWEQLERGPRSAREISIELGPTFGSDAGDILLDIAACLAEMVTAGVVQQLR